MDSAALQKQFSEIQEEQKRKLAMVKQRQNAKKSSPKTLDETFGVSDDLSLSVTDVMSSSTVGLNATLEAANTSMRDEIRELRDETGRLRKVMAEKEYEIKKLNRKISKVEEEKRFLSEAGVASDAASSKIVDLSKKNRELTAVMESEKSKSLRLQQKVNELEKKLNNHQDQNGSDDGQRKKSNFNQAYESPRVSVDELQDKLNTSNLKIADYRNQVQSLKQEMKVAHKVLGQELGETNVNIQQLLSGGGQGFRGRAQQVAALHTKVKDLETKLRNNGSPREDKNATRIRNMEKARKEQNDSLKNDLTKLQEQSSDFQRKWEASKARSKVLSSEVKSLKAQITVLTDKGGHDNELIRTLTRQQDHLQKMLERSSLNQQDAAHNEVKINRELHSKQQQESSQLAKLRDLLTERDSKLRELEHELEQMRISASAKGDANAGDTYKPLSVFSPPSRSSHREPPQQTQAPSPAPIAQPDLSTSEIAELRRKVTELEALYKASEIERQKLTELVAILNKRLQAAISKAETSISALHEEQRKIAFMEQKLESSIGQRNDSGGSTNRETSSEADVNTLTAQLTIQKDENNALKEALDSTLRGQQDDIAMYNEMSDQTKQVFLDALRGFGQR